MHFYIWKAAHLTPPPVSLHQPVITYAVTTAKRYLSYHILWYQSPFLLLFGQSFDICNRARKTSWGEIGVLTDVEVSGLGPCCVMREGILDLSDFQRPYLHDQRAQDYGWSGCNYQEYTDSCLFTMCLFRVLGESIISWTDSITIIYGTVNISGKAVRE